MGTYVRRKGRRVLERVITEEGSFEDTRLGLAAMEGKGGWHVEEPADAAPDAGADPAAAQPNETGTDPA